MLDQIGPTNPVALAPLDHALSLTLAFSWSDALRGLLMVAFIFVCVIMVLAVLIQKPQGGGLAAAFGGASSGSGQTAFGTKTGDALTVATIIIFVLFLGLAIALNFSTRLPTAATTPEQEQGATAPADSGQPAPAEGTSTPTPPAGDEPAPTSPTPTEPAPTSPAPARPRPARPRPARPRPSPLRPSPLRPRRESWVVGVVIGSRVCGGRGASGRVGEELAVVRSMTGFGEASAQVQGRHYFVEVRSLNNKYFKASIRLPEEFQALEPEIDAKLRERLTRGSVTLTARCSDTSATAAHAINAPALRSYVEQLRGVLGADARIDPASLLLLPGVLQPPADSEDRLAQARGAFFPLIEKAVTGLIAMREREGRSLVEDLHGQVGTIAERLSEVMKLAPGVVAEYENRLRSRIEMLVRGTDAPVTASDLIREIAVYAERTDVAEEVKRLSVHLDQFQELIAQAHGKPIGRTLDFLAQEMLREANTIASKSPDAGIAKATVQIKGAIDRIKEQVQNLE